MPLSLGELYVVLDARTSEFDRKLTGASARLSRFGTSVSNVGRSLSLRVTAPLMAMAYATGRWSKEFNEAFEETNTMMKLSTENGQRFRDAIIEVSNTYGKAASDIMRAGYKVSSVLHTNAEDSKTILEATTRAAKAGKLTVVESTEAIVNTMSMWSIKAKDTAKVSDILAATVREGNANWRDAAMQIPRVSGVAIPLGMTLEEVGGMFAYMSGKANSAAMAAVSTTSLLMSLLRPSDRMRQALQELGAEWGLTGKITADALIKARGIGSVIKWLGEYIGDDTDLLGEMFRGIRGIIGATASFREESEGLIRALDGIKDSAGETQRQIDAGYGPAQRMADAFEKIRNAGIYAFDSMLPFLTRVVEKIGALALKFQGLDPVVRKWIVLSAVIAGAVGPILMFTGASLKLIGFLLPSLTVFNKVILLGVRIARTFMSLGSVVAMVKGGFAAIVASMSGLFLPIAGIVAGLAAVAAWLVHTRVEGDSFGEKLGVVFTRVKEFFVSAATYAREFASNVIGFFANFTENVSLLWGWLGRNWTNLIRDFVSALIIFGVNAVNQWVTFAQKSIAVWGVLIGWIKDNWKSVGFAIIDASLDLLMKLGTIANSIGNALIDGIIAGVTGAEFSLEGIGTQLREQFLTGFDAKGTFAERIASLNLTEGWDNPLEGFKSTIEDLPELNLDRGLAKAAEETQSLADSTGSLADSADKAANAGEAMNKAWKGAGAAVKGSVEAYSTIARTIGNFGEKLKSQAKTVLPVPATAPAGRVATPAVAPVSDKVQSARSSSSEKAWRQSMLQELASIDEGIKTLVGMIGTEPSTV